MFGRHSDAPKKRHGSNIIVTIFRLILSLVILGILSLATLQAYKHFSGVDPLKLSPESTISSLFSSEGFSELVTSLLTFKLPQSLSGGAGVPNLSGGSDLISPNAQVLYKFGIVSDSHNDNANLEKALSQAKEAGVKFVVGLGDYSNVGTTAELDGAKQKFEASGLTYYSTAGDHDLWDCRNRNLTPSCNYTPIFGTPYQSFSDGDIRYILIYNSDNYQGMDGVQLSWLEDELKRSADEGPKQTFLLMSTPLYHPSSDHYVGKVTPSLTDQARKVLELAKTYKVGEIIAGDVHFFTRYREPKTNLKLTTVGAVTQERNAQAPRFAIVTVYDDGGYQIEDKEIR